MALSPAEIVAPARLSMLPPFARIAIALLPESPVIDEKLVTEDPATERKPYLRAWLRRCPDLSGPTR